MSDYYFENLSPFDEAVESFKEDLRGAVKEEVQTELEALRTANREMSAKLADLSKLEQAAERARIQYEVKLGQAEHAARQQVQKEGLRALLATLDETHYRVTTAWDQQPKCEKCDDQRQLNYTTPRGRVAQEACECATRTKRYEVEELFVHEVARRHGKMLVWWESTRRHTDDDYISSPTVLESPDNVPLDDLTKRFNSYGFSSKDAAQDLADALNKKLP
jgi:transposase-like protein